MIAYADFLNLKHDYGAREGFAPLWMPSFLFDFQASLVDWAVQKGRSAIFADCGMGKTAMQLVWAENIKRQTNRSVLILTPLAVTAQTLDEAEKFSIGAHRAIPGGSKKATIQVANYEKLHHFEPANYAGIVCDESSILKNFGGARRAEITEFMRQIRYRLLCTATAAPNDWVELGTSSEALGYLGHTDMLSMFFTTKQKSIALRRGRFERDKYQLRGHARIPFWRWVASWARAARRPSDLGYGDNGFVLPDLIERHEEINARQSTPGALFDLVATNWHEEREAIRRTIDERCEAAAAKVNANGNISMVWCHLNPESSTLAHLIPHAVEIKGADPDEAKEEAARWFCHGPEERRVLISKPTIFGFGMNFQHACHMTYFPTHSYEQYYQATRRLWRFGQERPVTVDLIYTNGGKRMLQNLMRKAKAADRMFDELVTYMHEGANISNTYEQQEVEVPQWMK